MSFKIIKTKCGREFKVDADMFAEHLLMLQSKGVIEFKDGKCRRAQG